MQLANQTAIVTGASRGIGRAIALALAAEGADISFCHLNDSEAAKTATEIERLGRRVYHRSIDVCDRKALKSFLIDAQSEFGTPDILINNVGGSKAFKFTSLSQEIYDSQMDLNFRSMVFTTHAVFEGMIARGSGRIINIASQLGLRGAADMVLYASAKAAMIGFTRALAREAAPHGILVNSIAPGPIATERLLKVPNEKLAEWRDRLLIPRFGTPEEVAATALLLAGPGGTYYTGACLSPNGGDVMH